MFSIKRNQWMFWNLRSLLPFEETKLAVDYFQPLAEQDGGLMVTEPPGGFKQRMVAVRLR
ncbi:MAG: hypothetical protein KGL39_02690 [Patescibacteria group bacterium]|nr:hypothetical protein [Patescibacteria group bacterium]